MQNYEKALISQIREFKLTDLGDVVTMLSKMGYSPGEELIRGIEGVFMRGKFEGMEGRELATTLCSVVVVAKPSKTFITRLLQAFTACDTRGCDGVVLASMVEAIIKVKYQPPSDSSFFQVLEIMCITR